MSYLWFLLTFVTYLWVNSSDLGFLWLLLKNPSHWCGSAVGEKGKKWGEIGKILVIKTSHKGGRVGLGRGNGLQSREACLWCRPSIISDSGIMLWLVKCLNVDRFAIFQNHAPSIIGKRVFLKHRFKFLCKTFCLSLSSKKSKKYACGLLQNKNKLPIQILSSFYTLQSVINCRSHLQTQAIELHTV